MPVYGYGKILDVDLSAGRFSQKDIELEFARHYLGGMGFSSRILYDRVGAAVDPLSSDNIVIFANGPLTGTQAVSAGRTEITTKSPLAGIVGSGNTGGVWGAKLKHAGFDLIMVRGSAEKPVYLWIDDNQVELRKAGHVWGKTTHQTTDMIRDELDPSSATAISVLAIGPAGENRVRIACPINDYHHAAARSGAGAVLGAKKLKAIAVRGTGSVSLARPEEFREVAREVRQRVLAADAASRMPGAPAEGRQRNFERGCLPGKNYQTGVLPRWLETRGRDVAMKYFVKKEGTCHACPTSCFNMVEVKEGKFAGLKLSRATMPGLVQDWGAGCALENMPAIWKCKASCTELGLDYASTASVIALAMELFQRGIITRKDADGLDLTWGNEDSAIALIQKIASREGFGDVLAEGSVRAAASIGRGAERYVMATKGMEMMQNDPRSASRGWIFGQFTNPRGGDNVKSTHVYADRYNPNWWIDQFDMPEDVKKRIYSMPPQEVGDSWEGKPLMCRWFEDMYSVANALGLCFFNVGFRIVLGPKYLSRLYSACTGLDTSPEEMITFGERVFTLLKVYNIRQGVTRKDDTVPDRFFEEPMPEGPARGAKLSRPTIDALLDEYYGLRGWDQKTGMPSHQKLVELGLTDIADELLKLGKIPRS
jgi:aldehyde:ferredoxin oxidoreductase